MFHTFLASLRVRADPPLLLLDLVTKIFSEKLNTQVSVIKSTILKYTKPIKYRNVRNTSASDLYLFIPNKMPRYASDFHENLVISDSNTYI
jgi:hypothetical protein